MLASRHPCKKEMPVKGGQYFLVLFPDRAEFASAIRLVTYHCAAPVLPPFMKQLTPILLGKAFPLPVNADGQPVGSRMQSTLYWSYPRPAYDKDEVTISFYTEDLSGTFSCVLEGVSSAGVLHQESKFVVKADDN